MERHTSQHQQDKSDYNVDTAAASHRDRNDGDVYTKFAATPTAPSASRHTHEYYNDRAALDKHSAPLPFAVAVAPPTTTSSPPPPMQQSKTQSWLARFPVLLLFHTYNAALGITGFAVVIALLPLSVALLPICCIGAVTFRVAAYATEWLASADVLLANMLARGPHDTKLRVHPRMRSASCVSLSSASGNDTNDTTKRFATKYVHVTGRNVCAMLYFATIKFAIGILSAIAVGLVTGYPVCAVVFAVAASDYELSGFTYDDHPVTYVLLAVGNTLFGLFVLLPVAASLSRHATKCVCADDDAASLDTREPVAGVAPGMLV